EIALSLFAAHGDEQIGGGARLDTLGDDGQPELLAEADGRRDNGGVVGIRQHVTNEGAVDLQAVERKFLQVAQARKAGAEIVEHQAYTQLLDAQEDIE